MKGPRVRERERPREEDSSADHSTPPSSPRRQIHPRHRQRPTCGLHGSTTPVCQSNIHRPRVIPSPSWQLQHHPVPSLGLSNHHEVMVRGRIVAFKPLGGRSAASRHRLHATLLSHFWGHGHGRSAWLLKHRPLGKVSEALKLNTCITEFDDTGGRYTGPGLGPASRLSFHRYPALCAYQRH